MRRWGGGGGKLGSMRGEKMGGGGEWGEKGTWGERVRICERPEGFQPGALGLQ